MKRVFVFFDGQAVFKQAKACWNYVEANFDPVCLANEVTSFVPNRELKGFFFYTGVPQGKYNPELRAFWNNKIRSIRATAAKDGSIEIFDTVTRDMKYKYKTVFDKKANRPVNRPIGREKGIDVRIALDIVKYARMGTFDVLIVMSQDSDLTEAVEDTKEIAIAQNRIMQYESAFPFTEQPYDPKRFNRWGLPGTIVRRIYRDLYDNCVDPLTTTYWPRKTSNRLPFPRI
jgi:uncharacterized LabA/DUF88 family protein